MSAKFDKLMLDPEFRKLNAIEGLIADTAQLIFDLLEEKKMTQADLARLLKKTPAFVSQLLNGQSNMTIRTLAEVVYALGATVKVTAQEEGTVDSLHADCSEADEYEPSHSFRLFTTRLPVQRPKFAYRIKASEHKMVALKHSVTSDLQTEDVA